MTAACDGCGSTAGALSQYDAGNESGIAPIQLCSDCEDELHEDGCAVCGDSVPDSADEFLQENGHPETVAALHPDCRRELIFGEGGDLR